MNGMRLAFGEEERKSRGVLNVIRFHPGFFNRSFLKRFHNSLHIH